jgi:hypothetical protein
LGSLHGLDCFPLTQLECYCYTSIIRSLPYVYSPNRTCHWTLLATYAKTSHGMCKIKNYNIQDDNFDCGSVLV